MTNLSTIFSGIPLAELASGAESVTGTATDKANTPAGLTARLAIPEYYMSMHYKVTRSLRQKAYGLDLDVSLAASNHSTAANRYTIETPSGMEIDIGGVSYKTAVETEISLATAGNYDSAGQTANYQTAANRAGTDFYVYAEEPASGYEPAFIISTASTFPDGNTPAGNARDANNTRKIGGFHCLCAAAGDIANHALCDYAIGDILFMSVWGLNNRPICSPAGMTRDINHAMTNSDGESVVITGSGLWVDIYLTSGTGASTLSVNGGTISDNRNWMDFVDDYGSVGKRMLSDPEFQLIAAGSNEETNIAGSAASVTTGGHSDTASRRMISNIGCEDCCGVIGQWLSDQSSIYDDAVTAGWYDLAGAKGSLYRAADSNDSKLLAGGGWNAAADSGSRDRGMNNPRWGSNAIFGSRGACEAL